LNSSGKILSGVKKVLIILLMLLITFGGYVAVTTVNTKNMTIRQRVLKAVYPAFTWLGKLTGRNVKSFSNDSLMKPGQSIYELSVNLNNGTTIPLSNFKGKKMLLVNTASDCGYTNQYAELEELFNEHKDKLMVIGFPANNFKQQEKKTDEEIAQFCKLNYGVSFLIAKKSNVLNVEDQNPVFQWLTDKHKNGWTNKKPSWNFSKYLVNEEGILINYFDPAISPTGKEVMEALKK
jgi:glutathione peroxidase